MLNGTADRDSDVELRRDGLSRLPDLFAVRAPSCIDNGARRSDGTAEGRGEIFDHLKVLMSARKAGVEELRDIKYLAFDSGSVAITQLLGGHIDAFTGDLSEALGFVESGDLRLLAVFSEERLPGELSGIPTAREQGIDVIAPNWRGFYMPADISDEAKQYWVDAVDELYASDEWKKVMKNNGLMPFHVSGAEFEEFVHQQIQDIQSLSKEIGLIKQ